MFPLSSLSEAEKVLREISGYNVQVIASSIFLYFAGENLVLLLATIRQITLAYTNFFFIMIL